MNKVFLVIVLLVLTSIGVNKLFAQEVEGLTDDLSGKTAKVIAVVEGDTIYFEDGTSIKESEFTETVSKTEESIRQVREDRTS